MDWKALITDLMNTGLSQATIGQHLGMSQAWVSDLVRGRTSTMHWEVGEKLIALHKRRMKARGRRVAVTRSRTDQQSAGGA